MINYVPRGYQKVAEFTINNVKDYSNVLNGIEFYDLKDNNKVITREFDYKYLDYENVVVDDYEKECRVIWVEENQTNAEVCDNIKIGSHSEQKEIWRYLNKTSFSEEESIIIGIFTNVEKGDYVEWIPTFYGVEINEWANWIESLNAGLISYYKLDEGSGTIIDIYGTNNATNNGALNTTGRINSAYDFESTEGDYIESGANSGLSNNQARTISIWIKKESNVTAQIFTIGASGSLWTIRLGGGGTDLTLDYDTGGNTASNITIWDTNWHHIVGIYNGTNGKMYVDGNITADEVDSVNTNSSHIFLSRNIGASDYFDGLIDEVGIWNRTLTLSEISDLWNGGDGLSYGAQNYTIRFNLTDSVTNITLSFSGQNKMSIVCNPYINTGLIAQNPTNNITNIPGGTYSCDFTASNYYSKTQNITVNDNQTITIPMSEIGTGLTEEEHEWLEEVHNCLINGIGCYS